MSDSDVFAETLLRKHLIWPVRELWAMIDHDCRTVGWVAAGRLVTVVSFARHAAALASQSTAIGPGATAGAAPHPNRGIPLTSMHISFILMYMRTTLNIDDGLLNKAGRLSGIREKSALIHAGLQALIARESARRLAALGGTQKSLRRVTRRRTRQPSS